MTGWYRMHRGWMDHALFQGDGFCKRAAFQWMIQEAAFQPTTITTKGGNISLDRGQFSHSIRFMAAAWKWDEKKVRRFLEAGAAADIIQRGEAAGQTVITICNYDYYQGDQRGGAAAVGAAVPEERRGGAANKKEGKEIKKDSPARAGARGQQYAFEGQTVRLTQKDFDTWQATYSGIADIRAELMSIDAWWQGQAEDKRSGWFHATSRMLNGKHQKAVAERAATPGLSGLLDASDASFERRQRWEKANPDAAARYAEMDALARNAGTTH